MRTTQTQAAVPTGTWRADPIHSGVGFAVRHVVGTFEGGFEDFDVTLAAEDDTVRISGTASVASVRVGDENLNAHLLSPDFFDAERYPEIDFQSSGVRRESDEILLEGELALKDVRGTVEARGGITGPLAGPDGSERLGLDLETTLDRGEIGLDWNAPLPQGGPLRRSADLRHPVAA